MNESLYLATFAASLAKRVKFVLYILHTEKARDALDLEKDSIENVHCC